MKSPCTPAPFALSRLLIFKATSPCALAPPWACALAAVAIRQRMALADGAEQTFLVRRLGEAIADAICGCSPTISPEQEFLVAFDNFWLLGDQAQLAALAEAQTHVRESAVERWRFLRRPRA